MASSDWFRNTSWNEDISVNFESKLKRARDKSQYLRLQACHLADAHPLVALGLLDRYFLLGEKSQDAAAHVDRATAHLALGNTEAAVQSYEAAIEHEMTHPSYITGAQIDLPYLVATNGLTHYFDRALDIISGIGHSLLVFPVNRFKLHASKAIILAARGAFSAAQPEARAALEAASQDHSGFRYHPKIGLVSHRYAQALLELRKLCDA